jgi:2,4-dienoyl-CoA reductase-like NADH-dependent reductase (Old Yellow Enzyme family)
VEIHPLLFTPVRLSAIELAHRVVTAPLTRLTGRTGFLIDHTEMEVRQ